MSDHHNEISVIGSLLISPETFEIISSSLTSSDFGDDWCRAAWLAAVQLNDNGEVIDIASISELMSKAGYKNNSAWLLDCMNNTSTAANVELYCKLTKQSANRRRLLDIAGQIGDSVEDCEDWQAIVSKAVEQIDDIKDAANTDIVSSSDMACKWLEYYDKVSVNPDFAFCRTGYKTLDSKLGGGMFRKGLYVIGARPGMGKTTLGVNIAENIARRNKNVLVISLEMSDIQIMAKRIANEAKMSYNKLLAGGLTDTERDTALGAAGILSSRPFDLIDKSKMTVVDIGRAARQIKGLEAIVIDYLQLVKPNDTDSNKPRYEIMTDISANLKALAKLLGIPVVALCQLNRESTKGADKRPHMQDLRDTGAIEQDADAIILLHRPEYYADKNAEDYVKPMFEQIEMIVAKNRHGETGLAEMVWNGATGNISELDMANKDLPFDE